MGFVLRRYRMCSSGFIAGMPRGARSMGGTGLGLAICRSIVEAAAGTIEIASTPGEGTCVTCLFRNT